MANFQMPNPEGFSLLEANKRTETSYKGIMVQDRILGELVTGISGMKAEVERTRQEHAEGMSLLREAIGALGQATTNKGSDRGKEVKVNTKQVRVAAPTVFKGDSDQVDQFLAECYLNFHNNPVYDNKPSKIAFALSYMKEGSTATWANNVVQAMCNPTKDATFYGKYEDFEKAVVEVFRGGAQVEITQAKMEALRQGKGTTTEYFTVLDAHNKTVGYDGITLIRTLKRGINKGVIQAVYNQSTLPPTLGGRSPSSDTMGYAVPSMLWRMPWATKLSKFPASTQTSTTRRTPMGSRRNRIIETPVPPTLRRRQIPL
jgi:hypothetical protein